MNPYLAAFLDQFTEFSPEERALLGKHLIVNTFEKGTYLVKEGDHISACFFVLNGCLRAYKLVDGEEKTTEFYFENEAAVFYSTVSTPSSAELYLVAAENTVCIVGADTDESDLYSQLPALEKVTRVMMEQDFGKTQARLTHFITSSPEERYLEIMNNRKHLLQRIPQHQIASYIGVTPESLSRIRKRLLVQ
jgi:CRP-like cAMP-binding protein